MASIFDYMFGTGGTWQNPADAAMPYLQQIPGVIQPYYQPYIDTGLNSMNQYYNNASMWATPQGAQNNYDAIAAGYTSSPYTQYQTDQMTQAMGQSAAASGQAGTPAQQAALAQQVNNINSAAEQNYINTILRQQQMAQSNLGDLTHLGYNSSDTLASALSRNLSAESALAYAGAANQNRHNMQQGNMWSSIFGMGANALASLPWEAIFA